MDLTHELVASLQIAREATILMGKMFEMPSADLRAEFKAKDGDTPVTVIDRTVGKLILRRLGASFPEHNAKDEDAGGITNPASPWSWNSDPVDGTRNLLFGLRQSVVGLNLNHEGRTVLSIVGNPFEKTLTYATKGEGAFVAPLGGGKAQQIRVDVGKPWNKKLLVIDSNFNPKPAPAKLKALELLSKRAMNVGSFGSNLYHWSLLAQGRAHYVLTDTVGGFWDIAAFLIVQEAGGRGTDLAGKDPFPECQVAFGSTGEDHDEILPKLAGFYKGYSGFR